MDPLQWCSRCSYSTPLDSFAMIYTSVNTIRNLVMEMQDNNSRMLSSICRMQSVLYEMQLDSTEFVDAPEISDATAITSALDSVLDDTNTKEANIVKSHLDSQLPVLAVGDRIPITAIFDDVSCSYIAKTRLESSPLSFLVKGLSLPLKGYGQELDMEFGYKVFDILPKRDIFATFRGPNRAISSLPYDFGLPDYKWVDTGQLRALDDAKIEETTLEDTMESVAIVCISRCEEQPAAQVIIIVIESVMDYENSSTADKVFDENVQRNNDDLLNPFLHKDPFLISQDSLYCLIAIVPANFFGNEHVTTDSLKLRTQNDPKRTENLGTLGKYGMLLVGYGKSWWLQQNFGSHVHNWFDTGQSIIFVGDGYRRSTHSVYFVVESSIAGSEFWQNSYSFSAISSGARPHRLLNKVVHLALLLDDALYTCSLAFPSVLSPANIIFPMPHVFANSQYSFVDHGQSFSFQNVCAKVVLPLFPNMNQQTQDTNFCCNISFAMLDASEGMYDMEYARQLLDQLSGRVMIGETLVLNRHLTWLQPAFGFPSCTWFGTGQKDLARLLCAGQRLIGVDQSILVREQRGLVELIDFTHLHGTDVQLHDVAILYWLAYSRQVVIVQHVHAFHDKLVKICRDNEQVFEVEYIDANWIDIPLSTVKVYFHHALSYTYLNRGDVLNDKVLYSCGVHCKDSSKKVILFSSCIFESVNSTTKMVLRGEADNHVSEELIFLIQNSSHHVDTSFLRRHAIFFDFIFRVLAILALIVLLTSVRKKRLEINKRKLK